MRDWSRREFLRTTAGAGLAASLLLPSGCGSGSPEGTPAEPAGDDPRGPPPAGPNLVFVFPDQFRRQAVGFLGEDPTHTPHLDRFCSESVVFTQAISNSPVCSPYRAMLLTGKWPSRNGVWTNCQPGEAYADVYLRPDETCLTDVLARVGYDVGYIGKWHLDRTTADPASPEGWGGYTPPSGRHGCNFWHAYNAHNQHLRPYYWTTEAGPAQWLRVDRWSPRHEADVAIDFLRRRRTKAGTPARPFALFVSMNPPHAPFEEVPPEHLEPYAALSIEQLLNRPNVDHSRRSEATTMARRQVRNYFAAVTGVDEQFGRILACLRSEGLEQDTIVVFTSDHGELMGSHDRMGKFEWLEESIGVPFVLRWPGLLAPRTERLLLSVPDIMPTLLGLMGLPNALSAGVQGSDHSGVLLTGDGPRPASALYVHWRPGQPHPARSGVRTDRYTLCVQRGPGGDLLQTILHDNERDPFQLRNLAATEASTAAELLAETNALLRTVFGVGASA